MWGIGAGMHYKVYGFSTYVCLCIYAFAAYAASDIGGIMFLP